MFTITYFDDDHDAFRRVVQEWTVKGDALGYARDLRRIYGQVKVVPVSQARNIELSTVRF